MLTQRVLLAGWLARPPRRGSDSKSVNTHAPRQTTWDVSSNMHGHELISTHSKNFEVSGCDLWATADLFGSGSATADGTCSLRTTRQMNRAPPVRVCLIPVRQGKRCVLLRQKTPDQRDRGNLIAGRLRCSVLRCGKQAMVAGLRATVRKRDFSILRHLYIKLIILPRQAWDKHMENSKKDAFLQGSSRTTLRDRAAAATGSMAYSR